MTRTDLLTELAAWAGAGRFPDLQAVASVAARLAATTARERVRMDPWPAETVPVPEGWTCRRCEMHRREYRFLSPCETWVVNVRIVRTPKGRIRVRPWTWARRVEGAKHEGLLVDKIPAVVDEVLRNGGTFRWAQGQLALYPEPQLIREPLCYPGAGA